MNITEQTNLHYEFTEDTDLIEQYTKLRYKLYPTDEKFKGFRTFNYLEKEDYKKENGHMLIVYDDNKKCVGGAGLVISTPEDRIPLPLEQNILPVDGVEFNLSNIFPQMELEKHSYGEFNRIVLEPEYRTGYHTRIIFEKTLNEAKNLGLRYMFGMGDKIRARLYKKLYGSFGLNVNIMWDIDVPQKDDYENIKMYVMSMDLNEMTVPSQEESKLRELEIV